MIPTIENLKIAILASRKAGEAILEVYQRADFGTELKNDTSPLTRADLAANEIINSYLEKTAYPIISEENKEISFSERASWSTCWIVDPLDGTKEFIKRNGEFTVNIALCHLGKPLSGVIYTPVTRELFYADVATKKAFKTILDAKHEIKDELFIEKDRIFPAEPKVGSLRIVGSRSHMNQDTLNYISEAEKIHTGIDIVSKGSSLKFCLVAEGKADVYPRFAPTMEWDTAAGHCHL